ncbi:MAG: hypothetical protein ACE5JG_03730 [Planctomycetota bacterium]
MSRDEAADLSAYLGWITGHRANLVHVNDRLLEREEFSWGAVPWWEYR